MTEQYKHDAATDAAAQQLRTYEGAVAIVTGAASGIGKAFAEELVSKGAHAIVLVDRQRALADEVATSLNGKGAKTKTYEVDVRNFEDMKRVITETVDAYGRLDYIFNNAGIAVFGSLEEIGVEDFNYVLDVNVRGVANGIHAAYPVMKERGFGHIVNTASIVGLAPVGELYAAVGASKYAVVGLSENLRIEAARHGVNVSVVCPGFVDTPVLRGGKFCKDKAAMPPELTDELLEEYPPMDANKFAKRTLQLVAKNKPIIVVPAQPWKTVWVVNRLSPSLGLYLARKRNLKYVKKLRKIEG